MDFQIKNQYSLFTAEFDADIGCNLNLILIWIYNATATSPLYE